MGSNIIELAKLGHERAAELKASCGAVDVQSVAQLMQLIGDLATQLEVQFVRSTNMAVQLANAESKCGELVAENAGLKDAAEFATAPDMWEDLGGNVMRYQYQEWYADRLKSAMKTPATDDFLSEERAQGVEMFSEKFGGGTLLSDMVKEAAKEFAAQLRKGVQS